MKVLTVFSVSLAILVSDTSFAGKCVRCDGSETREVSVLLIGTSANGDPSLRKDAESNYVPLKAMPTLGTKVIATVDEFLDFIKLTAGTCDRIKFMGIYASGGDGVLRFGPGEKGRLTITDQDLYRRLLLLDDYSCVLAKKAEIKFGGYKIKDGCKDRALLELLAQRFSFPRSKMPERSFIEDYMNWYSTQYTVTVDNLIRERATLVPNGWNSGSYFKWSNVKEEEGHYTSCVDALRDLKALVKEREESVRGCTAQGYPADGNYKILLTRFDEKSYYPADSYQHYHGIVAEMLYFQRPIADGLECPKLPIKTIPAVTSSCDQKPETSSALKSTLDFYRKISDPRLKIR